MKYKEYILKILRETNDLEEDDTSKDDTFNAMTPQEVFEDVLRWNGIIGYELQLYRWISDIFDIDLN